MASYDFTDHMQVPVREFTNAQYPEDPANRSSHHGQYTGRTLSLDKIDETHYRFTFTSTHSHIATVTFNNVDLSLMVPSIPDWVKPDDDLTRIALTDRQWNRQQVSFGGLSSQHISVFGGDGFETSKLVSAELAKNCLSAGLWEILLFTDDGNGKSLYYQGWFQLPLGIYKHLFEKNTGFAYREHAHYLEQWSDPEGAIMNMKSVRRVVSEQSVAADFNKKESILAVGDQLRKRKTVDAINLRTWDDIYCSSQNIKFAAFVPPGRYTFKEAQANQFERLANFTGAIWRDIDVPTHTQKMSEIELRFKDANMQEELHFIVSGVNFRELPQLPVEKYNEGLYMPLGIGIPPFSQSYDVLQKNPSHLSPFVSVLLDSKSQWVNHHDVGLDGTIIHRDLQNSRLLHIYLLSYERHMLIGHFTLVMPE
jgi:hypothetical protein